MEHPHAFPTSRGARQIAREYVADDCVIGHPGGTAAITPGYKGRVLIDLQASADEGHTAGLTQSAAEEVAAAWHRIDEHAVQFNDSRPRLVDQILPSLRSINGSGDGLTSQANARIGFLASAIARAGQRHCPGGPAPLPRRASARDTS